MLESLVEMFVSRNLTLATVESCTGGGIASHCTDLPGSSAWFNGAVVTYSNEMKVQLGVDCELLEQFGAVSEPVVRQMAESGRKFCAADWSIAVTGIAGPAGGSEEKPVGTVWFAWADQTITRVEKRLFTGNRASIRDQTVRYALKKMLDLLY